jgi:hypothetical protein
MVIHSLLEHGFSLIPVERQSKRPHGSWKHAQTERANMADVCLWIDEGHNLGVVTGSLSGVVVVDCDSASAVARVTELGHDPTPTVLTGRGAHLYFHHPGASVRNAVALEDGIDVRGDGGYVICPPSIHPSGEPYRFAPGLSLGDVSPAELPAWALTPAKASQNGREPGEWEALFKAKVGSGQRNQRCAELSGYLLRKWVDRDVATYLLQLWNERACVPPMSAGEVRRTVASIAAREERRRGR